MVGFWLVLAMGGLLVTMGGWRHNAIYLVILGFGAPLFTMYLWSKSGVDLTIMNVASMADLGGMIWAAIVACLKALQIVLDAWDANEKRIMDRIVGRVRRWLGLSS